MTEITSMMAFEYGVEFEKKRVIELLRSKHIDDGCPEFRPCYACECAGYVEESK